mmetsp:Transcript_40279/g.46109  ORF Transcript_40279/g.46109 Transcript_40279/m.46109 type:complete len:1290 (+) Transcript_40279:164-4033(+)
MQSDTDDEQVHLLEEIQEASGSSGGGVGESSRSSPSNHSSSDHSDDNVDQTLPVTKLYDLADRKETAILYSSALVCIISGTLWPFSIIFVVDILAKSGPGYTRDEAIDEIRDSAWDIFWVAMTMIVTGGIWMLGFSYIGKSLTNKLRVRCFKAVLKNEISWFDDKDNQTFNSQLVMQTQLIEDGCGPKAGRFLFRVTIFLFSCCLGFRFGLQLACVTILGIPLIGLAARVLSSSLISNVKTSQKSYVRAGAVAEESISGIKTITATNAQEKRLNMYEQHLQTAKGANIQSSAQTGFGRGLIDLALRVFLAGSFYFGYILVSHNVNNVFFHRDYDDQDVVTVIGSILVGAVNLSMATALLKDILEAQHALYKLNKIIDQSEEYQDRVYEIDSVEKLGDVDGSIEFIDVDFNYPSRPDAQVFSKLNLSIPANQTTAIVGETGCGKSSVIQLIERFYEPTGGKLLFGGRDSAKINPNVMRTKIALVSQEPLLFATTLFENIKVGNPSASPEQVIEASKRANAHGFIMDLPDQYETMVGVGGSQLSGGQKQRIAIARALIKNPLVLILDEATSALDNVSEREVQDAIAKISGNLTQIIIAHRLSTIRSADQICVLQNGNLAEHGTHTELEAKNGVYAGFLHAQQQEEEQQQRDTDVSDRPRRRSLSSRSRGDLVYEESSRSFIRHLDLPFRDSAVDASAVHEEGHGTDSQKRGNFGRLMDMSAPERKYLAAGTIFAVLVGASQPAIGVLFSYYVDALQGFGDEEEDEGKLRKRIRWYCVGLIAIGLVQFSSHYFSQYFFGIASEELTVKIRKKTLRSFFKMPMRFFDRPEHSPGALSTILESDCRQATGLAGDYVNFSVQAGSSLLAGIVLASIWSWRMAIVLLFAVPLFAVQGLIRAGSQNTGGEGEDAKELGGIVSENVTNIRVVRSFGAESRVVDDYDSKLQESSSSKTGYLMAFLFGFSISCPSLVQFIAFMCGAEFVEEDLETLDDIITAFLAILFAGIGATFAAGIAPDMAKSDQSATAIFMIHDEENEADPFSEQGTRLSEHELVGNFEFREVCFKYPQRDHNVLESLSFHISEGQSVALMGPSGSGKSTAIQLILRFYDPIDGSITLDGRDLDSYNLRDLRSQYGLVSQEPVLFDTTIEDNIRYGCADATDEQVREAARQANALEFIDGDESGEGFKRMVGARGSKLSGGQKQRVAIARAIIRQPNILLLDEATSALDNQAEKVVQEALDKVMLGKTTIVIAHKIATIQNCDKICVFQDGSIVEQGKHEELLKAKGTYFNLAKAK